MSAAVTGLDDAVAHTVALAGPGDVRALAGDQIAAVFPEPDARDAEYNYFPFVTFNRPDLPWMFTPSRHGTDDRLMPWLVLVVVQESDDVVLTKTTDAPGFRLSLRTGAKDLLPDLAEAHGWAHAEATDPGSDAATVSRLMCPVRLNPRDAYLACLVPSFEAGRLAGLGQDVSTAARMFAWDNTTQSVDLPVYFHWRFGTGSADFEELVRRLSPNEAGPEIGVKTLDISVPRAGMNADELVPGWDTDARVHVSFAGALVSPVVAALPWADPHRGAFQDELAERLAEPTAGAPAGTAGYRALEDDPLVGLPLYGKWQDPDLAETPPEPDAEGWAAEANLNAPQRAQAGVGATIVRRLQEELMTEAWATAASHQEITGVLRRGRLAQTVGNTLHARIASLSTESLLHVTEPVHAELTASRGPGVQSFDLIFEASNTTPLGAFDSGFRRATVRADAIARRTRLDTVGPLQDSLASMMFSGASLSLIQDLPGRGDGLVQNAPLSFSGELAGLRLAADRARRRYSLSSGIKGFAGATKYKSGTLGITRKVLDFEPYREVPDPPPVASMRVAALTQLNPEITVTAHVEGRVTGLAQAPNPTLAKIPPVAVVDLEFRRPAYLDLAQVSPELLLPGYGSLPDNSVTMLSVNRAFIEAFHLGLNHEMAQELAWRQYPADLRSTWFRTFWDYPDAPERRDITRIADWAGALPLGEHQPPPPADEDDEIVVLIKGDLFTRYPNTLIYAVPATWAPQSEAAETADRFAPASDVDLRRIPNFADPAQWVWPSFEGVIGAKGAFFGFPKSAATLTGSKAAPQPPGYFIVFEQPSDDTRFGLDISGDYGVNPGARLDLAWTNFADSADTMTDLRHVPLAPQWGDTQIGDLEWGRNSAHQAALCFQDAVRLAMHADSLIREP